MLLNFTSDESLKNMDTAVKENMKDLKFWGDLNLSRVSLDILKNRIIILLERGMVFKSLFEQYPYAMVSYVVFLTRSPIFKICRDSNCPSGRFNESKCEDS